MIEIQNVEAVNKGAFLAKCDVYIKPWHMILKEVKIFEKGTYRFVGLPARKWETDEGDKWVELVQFDSDAVKKRFCHQVKEAVEAYLEKNPNMEPEPVIEENEDLPF